MRLLIKQHYIDEFVENFKKGYFRDGVWDDADTYYRGESSKIYEQLKALNPPTEESIRAIVWRGHGFDEFTCAICDEDVDEIIIEIDVQQEYDTRICRGCLEKALALFTKPASVPPSAVYQR